MPKIIKSAKGSFTATDITVDSSGRVISASSGSAGANLVATFGSIGPSSGNYTAQPNANYIVAYIGGGGGGAGRTPGNNQAGGAGGFAVYATPISQPYTKAYSVGARGTGQQSQGGGGNGGGATNFGSPATVTANGGGGAGGPGGSQGNQGTVSGETFDMTSVGDSTQGSIMNKSFRVAMGQDIFANSPTNFDDNNARISMGQGGPQSPGNVAEGGMDGGAGFLYIYENLGS